MVIYKGMEFLQEDLQVWDSANRFIVWYDTEEKKHGIIFHRLLKVEGERSDGVCYLLGPRGCNTTCNSRRWGGSGDRSSVDMVQHFRKRLYFADQFDPGLWRRPKKRKWSAYLRPHR